MLQYEQKRFADMVIPSLKRIKVSSSDELENWLAKNSTFDRDIMFLTCSKKTSGKYLSSAAVRDVLARQGWAAGRSYTLNGDLLGHVASRS